MKKVKRRLAKALNLNLRQIGASAPMLKMGSSSVSERTVLTNSRYNAGITPLSLFGNNRGLDYYSPPG